MKQCVVYGVDCTVDNETCVVYDVYCTVRQ